jgi:hypothetical protein
VKSRHQRKTAKSQRRKQRLQRQLQVERSSSFEPLEDRMLLAADLGAVDLPVAEGEAFGTMYMAPTTHEAGEGYLSGTALGQTPMQVTSDFFTANASQYGLDPSGLGEFRVLSEYISAHTRVTHIALQQQHNGIDVFGSMVNINLDNDGSILTAASSFVSGLEDNAPLTSTMTVSPQQAFASAAAGMGLTLTENVNVISETTTGQMDFILTGGGVTSGAIQGHAVYLPTPSGVALAWQVQFMSAGFPANNTALVDGTVGDLIFAYDNVNRASYKAIKLPGNDLESGDAFEVIQDPATSNASPFGWHDTNGIEGPEFTITRGNNAHVVLGDEFPAVAGFNPINRSPDGGADLDFNFDFDIIQSNQDPVNQDAVMTNVFYVVNTLHDVLFNYGFDEAAGNFQATNYTGQDGGGDHLTVHVQDTGEPPNFPAPCDVGFMATPNEGGVTLGQNPYMALGYCNTGINPISRDLGLSNDVIVHEYAHGQTVRLVGGPAAFLSDLQMGAMNEGTSDYMMLMFGMEKTDGPNDKIEFSPWEDAVLATPERPNPGLRRLPYSYNTTFNPITFDQWNDNISPLPLPTDPQNTNDLPHNGGEIWASTLYDMTWELIAKYGGATGAENFTPGMMEVAFNEDLGQAVSKLAQSGAIQSQAPFNNIIFSSTGPDFLDLDTGANNYAMQLVIDGMKLAPIDPSFSEMRDSIMAADIGLTGGVNLDVIWKAFARRGLGFSSDVNNAGGGALPSTAPFPFNSAFDLPTNPADISGNVFIDANEDGVRNVGESPLANATIFMDLNGNGTRERLEPYTVTDIEGDYNIKLYTGGEFKIRALPVPDFVQTEPSVEQIPGGEPVDGSHEVFVVNGNSTPNVDFGFTPSAVSLGVFGTKYEDVNGNGVQDDPSIEKGMAGVYMYLDIDNDLRIDIGEPAAITDADGHYAIEFHQPGNYTVREVPAPGWATTEPAIGHHDITMVSGLPVLDVNFGNQPQNDYGDAPAPYPTLIADGGAVHGILSGFSLGTTVDFELDGIPSGAADGDDLNTSDDEDGILFNNGLPLVKGLTADIEVTVTNGSNSPGVVQGWIDFNADGDWNDAGEQVMIDQRIPEGTSTITINVPEEAAVGLTYARFRYGYERGIGPAGAAMAGEVEDYQVLILDDNPVALDDFFNCPQNTLNKQLDVLANDFASSTGSLIIVAVGTPDQGGSVSITPDGQQLFYTPANNFASPPLETFTYTVGDSPSVDCAATPERCSTANVVIQVQPAFINPIAVDDYQDVVGADVNAPGTVIDVVANDIEGANGPLTLVPSGLTQPANGTAQVDLATNEIRYTPDDGFYNLDQFSYTVTDTNNTTVTANVSVQVSKPGGGCSPDQELASCDDGINFIVETINPVTGTPLTQVDVGQEFEVRVSLQDARGGIAPADAGLYAAFMDVLFDADFVDVKPSTTPIVYSSFYTIFHQGVVGVPGVVNELGAVQAGFTPLGNGVIELAHMTFIAKAAGIATIQLDPADVSPIHDSLVHEPDSNQVVDHAIVSYGSRVLTVNSSGGGSPEGEIQLDTSGDGHITPLDALQVINDLNTFGARALTLDAEGEIATPNPRLDVNHDDFISPLDALAIITYLNEHSGVVGEGEAPVEMLDLLATNLLTQQVATTSPVGSTQSSSSKSTGAVQSVSEPGPVVIEQPRQLAEGNLQLARWMVGSGDANQASDDDLESMIDSLADDVAEQWRN